MPRRARIVIPHLLHHITQRGNHQAPVFFSDDDRLFFLDLLVLYTQRAGVQIASYCLMTNHTHLLLVPSNEEGLARALKPLHMRYSQRLNWRAEYNGLNWQGRFFSSALDERHAWNAFRYVADNPVRAHMTSSAIDYRWSSAKDHMTGSKNPILTASNYWLLKAQNAVRAIHLFENIAECNERLRRNTLMNIPTGSDTFIARLEEKYGRQLAFRPRGRPRKG